MVVQHAWPIAGVRAPGLSTCGRHACATSRSIHRLAPEHPFPAAVEDTTAAYRAISRQSARLPRGSGSPRFSRRRTGHRNHAERDVRLPMPAAGYGMSSWLDLSCEGKSFTELAAVDPLMTAEEHVDARGGLSSGLRWSPSLGFGPHMPILRGSPPLMLQVGSTEMFLDDSTRAARTAALAGVHVEMQVWPDMPHVWHLWPSILPEAAAALAAGGRFLRT